MSECPFLGLSNTPLCVFTTFAYPSSVLGHWGCFLLLAIVSDAAMNVNIQISFCDLAFCSFVCILPSGMLDHILISEENSKLFSSAAAPFYILTSSAPGFQFLHILANTYYFLWGFVFVCFLFFLDK